MRSAVCRETKDCCCVLICQTLWTILELLDRKFIHIEHVILFRMRTFFDRALVGTKQSDYGRAYSARYLILNNG